MTVAGFCLLGAAPAAAAVRYAAQGETDTSPCSQADPCNIQSAVEGASGATSDEVIIGPGTYTLAADDPLLVEPGTNVHGDLSGARPEIISSTDLVMGGDTGTGTTRVHHLKLKATGGGSAFAISGGTAEDVVAETNGGQYACFVLEAILRDSVCWNTGNGIAAGLNVQGTATLRNVTAVATGANSAGVEADSFTPGNGAVAINVKSSIVDGGQFDAWAATDDEPGNSATVTLDRSNYFDRNVFGTNASVTAPGPPANQDAAPLFVNAPIGNFHQATGSPTIDAGAADTFTGSADIDGEARVQGPAIDIGADETSNPPAQPPAPVPDLGADGDTSPPDTHITKSPPSKSKSKSATFEFSSSEAGSSFECKRDATSFQPCASPNTFKVGKGKHSFQVRATDAAGNTDPTPAAHDWKFKPKKKK